MGMFDKLMSKKIETEPISVDKEVQANLAGKAAANGALETNNEEMIIKARMSKWTPRQRAALESLLTGEKFFAWSKSLQNLTAKKLDIVEKFAANPSEVIKSASYNEATGSFEATGVISEPFQNKY